MNKTYKDFKRSKERIVSDEPSGIFFRSSANNWTTENEFFKYGENSYICRNVKLNKGLTEFKIADKDYSIFNFGIGNKNIVPKRYTSELAYGTHNARIVREEETTADVFVHRYGDKMKIFVK